MTKDERRRARDRARYRRKNGSVRRYARKPDPIAAAIALLQKHDYRIVPPQAPGDFVWETPSQVIERLKISKMTFARRLADPDCPGFEKRLGFSGRIIQLLLNIPLEEFLTKHRNRRITQNR